ncbi:MAG: pyridoxamine 5-phosphate oxidase family protein [Ferruginibacter sp.]|uniref:pyridoxamine 5'-phosphate oxidase family protein n=1 Tax=Ferruginibacter sp. TaxID=1940288 RepID=UPI002657F631|nr:pyridoxamine 5'-phosphate oxidase family protein [Ferruginibacter sp.]MDB5279674.1 pyridoxamine 5-phosphate oxidase family protein [Ferruginibacter sp.]
MTGELNETQINNLLSSQVVGRLGCSKGKQPYVVPVTFAYDGVYIYGQTTEGTKLEILRKNPKVCFEVDTMTDMKNWQSVIIQGIFEELKSKEAEQTREILYNRIFPLSTSSTIHTYGYLQNGKVEDNAKIKDVMYRIAIKKVTGRFEKG